MRARQTQHNLPLSFDAFTLVSRRSNQAKFRDGTSTESALDKLISHRLLVSGREKEIVEFAHEELLRTWQVLQDLVKEKKDFIILRGRLITDAKLWYKHQANDELWSGSKLARLRELGTDKTFENLGTEVQGFINKSIELSEQKEKEQREQIENLSRALTESRLRETAARSLNLSTVDPVGAMVLAIQAMGENIDNFPQDIIPPVSTSLHQAERSLARVPLLLQGHRKLVTSVIFSPDSQTIVSFSNREEIVRFWDLQGNLQKQDFLADCNVISYSPDGTSIVIGGKSGELSLWNLNGSPTRQHLGSHTDRINAANFNCDGQMIVSGSDDGTVRLWNGQGQAIGNPFLKHKDSVMAVAFSPDGQKIISAGYREDKTLCLWNLQGTLVTQPFQGHEAGILCVAFHPSGHQIISGGVDLKLYLWDIQGNLLAQTPVPGFDNSIESVAFSPDGKILVSTDMLAVRLWRVYDNKIELITEIDNNYNFSKCAFSPDGQIIATTNGQELYLWNLQDFLFNQFKGKHDSPVYSAAFSLDGKNLISIGSKETTKAINNKFITKFSSNLVRCWDLEFNPIDHELTQYNSFELVKVSQDGRYLVTASDDNKSIQLLDLQGYSIGKVLQHQGYAHARYTKLSLNGKYILTASGDNQFHLWDLQGSLLYESCVDFILIDAALSPDGHHIVTTSNCKLQLWSTTCRLSSTIMENDSHKSFRPVDFSPDGNLIVCATPDHSIYLWDLAGKLQHTLQGHTSSITSIAFSPDGQYIVSGSCDKTIRLWDINGNSIGQPIYGHEDNVWTVAFSPDGKYIVSGSEDETVRLWRGHWQSWLEACCNKLPCHHVFKNPATPEQNQARATCQKHVWKGAGELTLT